MAYVEQWSISSRSHEGNSIAYVMNDLKTEYEFISGINCIPETVEKEFKTVKLQYGKTDGILAHHVIQSFKPGEVDAKTAHEIGVKFAEKIAPGYQVLISTHLDKAHLHNHILINSVNMETGYKYNACKDSLKYIRKESDKLCKEYGLSIIDSKGKGINRGTYRAAERGASYKVALMRTIDESIETALCAQEDFRKEEFIGYMKDMGYKVKWENKNISFKDEGHKNFIKGRMLSEDYTKEAIENRLGIFEGRDKGKELDTNREASRELDKKASGHRESTEINIEEPGTNIRGAKRKRKYKSEWERYRRSSEVQKASMVGKVIDDKKRKEDNILYQELKLALILIKVYKRSKKTSLINGRNKMLKVKRIRGSVRVNNFNGEYYKIKEASGSNYIFRYLNIDQVGKIKSTGIECAVFNNGGDKFNVVVKDKNKFAIGKVLGKDIECGSMNYRQLNKLMDGKNTYIKLSRNEYEKLINSNIKFAAFDKGSFINVIVKRDQFKDVAKVINRNFEEQFGNTKYSQILREEGQVSYKFISKVDVDKLSKAGIRFAAFDKGGEMVNAAFKEKDLQRVNEILNQKIKVIGKER